MVTSPEKCFRKHCNQTGCGDGRDGLNKPTSKLIAGLLGWYILHQQAVHNEPDVVLPDPGDVAPDLGLVDDQVHSPLPAAHLVAVQVNAIKIHIVVSSDGEGKGCWSLEGDLGRRVYKAQ